MSGKMADLSRRSGKSLREREGGGNGKELGVVGNGVEEPF